MHCCFFVRAIFLFLVDLACRSGRIKTWGKIPDESQFRFPNDTDDDVPIDEVAASEFYILRYAT